MLKCNVNLLDILEVYLENVIKFSSSVEYVDLKVFVEGSLLIDIIYELLVMGLYLILVFKKWNYLMMFIDLLFWVVIKLD